MTKIEISEENGLIVITVREADDDLLIMNRMERPILQKLRIKPGEERFVDIREMRK